MYIITGIGRSGTSFIGNIFHNLGYDMGKYFPDIDAGFENPEIAHINKILLNGNFWGTHEETEILKAVSVKYKVVKDPRFIITLGIWLQAKANIEGIFLCTRDYNEIIESSERTNAGTIALFNGWPKQYRKRIMKSLEAGIASICKKNKIEFYLIHFPDSLTNFEEIKNLNVVINDIDKLYKVWINTSRKR